MNEKQIALASLLLALFGLAVILLSTKSMKAKEIRIEDIGSNIGNYVEITGPVSSSRTSRENVFINICSGECITVVVFKGVAKDTAEPSAYLIKKGDRLVIRGEVQEYNGELELVVLRAGDIMRG